MEIDILNDVRCWILFRAARQSIAETQDGSMVERRAHRQYRTKAHGKLKEGALLQCLETISEDGHVDSKIK